MNLLRLTLLLYIVFINVNYANADSIIQYVSSKKSTVNTEEKETFGYSKTNLNAPILSPDEIKKQASTKLENKTEKLSKNNSYTKTEVKPIVKKSTPAKNTAVLKNSTPKIKKANNNTIKVIKASIEKNTNFSKNQKSVNNNTKTLKHNFVVNKKNDDISEYNINFKIPKIDNIEKNKSYSYNTTVTISKADNSVKNKKIKKTPEIIKKNIEQNDKEIQKFTYASVYLGINKEKNIDEKEKKSEEKNLSLKSITQHKEDIYVKTKKEDKNIPDNLHIDTPNITNPIPKTNDIDNNEDYMSFKLLKPKKLPDYPAKHTPDVSTAKEDKSYSSYLPSSDIKQDNKQIYLEEKNVSNTNKYENIEVLENPKEELDLYKKELNVLKDDNSPVNIPNAKADYKNLITKVDITKKSQEKEEIIKENKNIPYSNQKNKILSSSERISIANESIDELPLD